MYQKIFNFRLFIGLLLFAAAVLTVLAKSTPYFTFDIQVSQAIQSFNPAWFDFLMRFLSSIGNSFWPVVLTLFFCLIYAGLNKSKDALLIGISFIGTSLISIFLKILVERPRPDPELILQLTKPEVNPSFPSGHVLFAIGLFGFLLFLAYIELTKSWVKNLVLVLLLSSIILMGVSRIYLGVHWFSDVLGSYLIGTIWLYFMIYLYRRFKLS